MERNSAAGGRRMKRIIQSAGLAAMCLAVLSPGTVSLAGNGTAKTYTADQNIPVIAQYEPGQDSQPVYRVDVSWGDMKFIYRKTERVRWDASSHEYHLLAEEQWISGGDRITFVNHSNHSVTASVTAQMEQGVTGICAEFDQTQIYLDSAEGTAPEEAPSGEVRLSLSGSMDPSQTAYAKVGTVTLQIRQQEEGTSDGTLKREDSREILGRYEADTENVAKSGLAGGQPVTLDDGTVMEAESSSGQDRDVSAVIHLVSEEEVLNWLKARIGSPGSRMYPLWIGFYEGMAETVPDGEVTISMDIPDGFAGAGLYYVDTDGNVQKLSCATAGEQVRFSALQPGYYVWVKARETGTAGEGTTGDTDLTGGADTSKEPQKVADSEKQTQESAKTADTAEPGMAAGILLAALVVATAARRKIK